MGEDRTRGHIDRDAASPPSSAADRSSRSTTSAHFAHTAMPPLVARAFVQSRLTRLWRARSILNILATLDRAAGARQRAVSPGFGGVTLPLVMSGGWPLASPSRAYARPLGHANGLRGAAASSHTQHAAAHLRPRSLDGAAGAHGPRPSGRGSVAAAAAVEWRGLVALALGLALELDAIGVVDDAVEDRIRDRRLSDGVPIRLHRLTDLNGTGSRSRTRSILRRAACTR